MVGRLWVRRLFFLFGISRLFPTVCNGCGPTIFMFRSSETLNCEKCECGGSNKLIYLSESIKLNRATHAATSSIYTIN